jgi:AcrR family transcriptional regulator
MVGAAARLFGERGYAATTMEAIAAEAKVAVQTVYFTFHTKAELLSAVADMTIAGDGAMTPGQAAWVQAVRTEMDPRRQLQLLAEGSTRAAHRLGPVLAAFRAAMAADPRVALRYEARILERRDFVHGVVASIAARGQLRPDLDIDRAADIAFALSTPENFDTMTRLCGWTADEWSAWLAVTLAVSLLEMQHSAGRAPRKRARAVTRRPEADQGAVR